MLFDFELMSPTLNVAYKLIVLPYGGSHRIASKYSLFRDLLLQLSIKIISGNGNPCYIKDEYIFTF